ncbi:unnamed protein product [Adineta ricciae]|uniref:protein-tyrosine-phosphatase n=1 Tax=Adineta ricciae TaxID=249248 RepID=A0A815LVW7_ADIRI|nr:unnamed protein product [Adineta ricciae]CAF1431632.1 unnamed protein product [Adineta ricciae]
MDGDMRDYLKTELQATDEELDKLEKLIQLQQSKVNSTEANINQPSVIFDDFLYQGDLGHAIDEKLLSELKIQHIINLCDCPLETAIVERFDVTWIDNFDDNFQSQIREHLNRTNDLLDKYNKNKEKVLVHCQAGISRSSSIILAYLMKYNHKSLEEAYEYLLERRPIVAPNYGFLIQLIRYEKELENQKT